MDDEEERAEYYFWMNMGWNCIVDITNRRDLKGGVNENQDTEKP